MKFFSKSKNDYSLETNETSLHKNNCTMKKELEHLILNLCLIEKECIDEELKYEKNLIKDDFLIGKREICKAIMELNKLICDWIELKDDTVNKIESLKISKSIENEINNTEELYKNLKITLKKKGRFSNELSEEEIDKRYNEMQDIKEQIQTSVNIFRNKPSHSTKDIQSLEKFNERAAELSEVLVSRKYRECSSFELKTISKWKERDNQFDREIDEIGLVVDSLMELANRIGTNLENQTELVNQLNEQAVNTEEELDVVESQLHLFLIKQNSFNLVLKLVLSLILVGLIAFIIATVKRRI